MSRKNINDIFTISDELPFNTIGLFTFLRTYARRHEEDNPNSTVESWQETLQRVVLACNSQLKVGFTDAEMKELFNLLYNLKCSVAGRFLWQLGTKTVDKLGLPSLENCAAKVIDEPVRPFTWAMNFLMLGCVPPGTPILTENGIKKISAVQVGDKVWSYNVDTDKRELKTVTELHSPIIPKDLNIRLHGKYGSLTTSKKHPILVYRNNKWDYVLAGEVKEGDIVHRYHETFTDKDEISRIEDNLDIPEEWCDITVEDNNNYYAGEGSLYCTHNCGVGFRILPSDIDKIPPVKYAHNVRKDTNDADFIVPDSREGWVKLLGKVLKSHFYSGESFTYSCTLLRSKGAPIKGFGGLASGPEVLCQGMTKIDDILNARAGQKLRPIDALDIMNIIGMIVVSGNVRRSALLALGDVKDTEYLKAKRWDLGNIPNYRAFSNNSIVCNDIADILDNDDFWQGYNGNGEPYGLINLALSQSCGRLGETQYPDPDVIGYNPCAEQSLCNNEVCCLSELYLPNISSKEELFKCATYMYRICKHSLALPCNDSIETEKIVHKNMRMGIGVTGYLQATDEQRSWLSDCYRHLREFDKNYSIKHGFPVSIKLATCKPSGCARRDMLIQTNKGLLRLDEIGDVEGEQWQEVKDLYVKGDGVPDNYTPPSPRLCPHIFTRGPREGQICGTRTTKDYCGNHMKFAKANRTFESEQSEEKKDTMYPVNKFYVNGKVDTKKIITSDGLELEVSHNHRFRVISDDKYVWKYARDIEVGDNIVTMIGGHPEDIVTTLKKIDTTPTTNDQVITQPDILTPDIAWFLGLFYGDGSVHKKGIRIAFNRKHMSEVNWLHQFFKDVFNITTNIDDDRSFYVNSVQFLRWLDANECKKDFCGTLSVPRIIRTASKENAIAFINGFWRADGGIHNVGNDWSLCTISKTFVQELLVLCRSVGFNVKVTCAGPSSKYNGLGSNDRWILSIRYEDKSKDRYRCHDFRDRMCNPFWLDPVVIIEDSQCDTYDIEVDTIHHYRMNGTISHNTLSLLGGVTSGVHPGFARYYKRRIRIASESPLIKLAKDNGYHVEYVKHFDGSTDHTTQIVTFPCRLPDNTVLAEDCTAIDQLEWVKKLQTEWSDNSVSVTVYYRKHEIPEIKEWLRKNYNNSVKTVSFLLHSDHGFQQAPLEQITKAEYEELVKQCKPIKSVAGICFPEEDESLIGQNECVGGACPLR